MEIKDFIKLLKEKNFSLAEEKGKLILKGDRKKLSNGEVNSLNGNDFIISYIKEHKDELLKYISGSDDFGAGKKAKDISSIYRLSGLQEGMLFHGLYDENSGTHIVQLTCDFIDPDIKIFNKSWETVMENHTVLRSSIQYDTFNLPVQCVHKKAAMPAEVIDYSQKNLEEKAAAIEKFEEQDRLKGFDFKKAPLMRLTLFRLDEHQYRMLWTSHHIIFDGWSLQILMEEFLQTYEALITGNEVKKSAEDKYEDYIRYISNTDKEKEERYWRGYMKDAEQSTLLPFIGSTSQRTKASGNFEALTLHLDDKASADIDKYSQKKHLTINTLMQGVWSYLLHRYTGHDNITFGTIVSGRPDDLPGVEKRVGMFINTLPLHSVFDKGIKITQWLQKIQDDQINSQQFQFTPLYDIQKWSGIHGDLFDSILVFENYPVSKAAAAKQWKLKVGNVETKEQTNYPFIITVNNPGKVSIEFQYNTDLMSREYAEEIKDHFEYVLQQIISGDERYLSEIKLISDKEEHRLLYKYNDTKVDYPKDKTIAELFEAQVLKTPDNIAMVLDDRSMTYRELNERSNQLAHYLQSKGAGKETLVPICIERSFEMIIGILSIVKAGGVYVPVDPDYPEDRIEYILEDTSGSIVLTSKESCAKLKSNKSFDVIKIDDDWKKIKQYSKDNLQRVAGPENGAYIIYTSGSTGKPKGVLVQHYNVVRLFMTSSPLFDFTEKDVWTMFHSFCFDFTVWEMYGAFFFGGKLVLVPKQVTKDAELFSDLLIKEKVTILNQIPSSFYALQEVLIEKEKNHIRYIIFGGEALDPAKLRQWKKLNPDCRLINMYGITETTVHVTYQEIEWRHINSGNSIIGMPIPTLSLYILDRDFNLLPAGIAGELCIGGAGLARGYLNRPELTKERFIKNPFIDGERLYRSGDLGRRLPDGNIEYLGRIDEQVKIRGYRIELGEIESVLNECEFVMQSLVMAKADKENNKKLVAYIVPDGNFDKEGMTAYVKGKLPEYMVPSQWIELEKFPMTPSGKIDKKALPDVDEEMLSNIYIAPVTDNEKKVVSVWHEVLGVDKVGIHDNFFELGGDSIKVIRVVHRLRKIFNKELKVYDIYNTGTVAELVSLIEKSPMDESRWNEILLETEKDITSLKEKLLPALSDTGEIEDVYPVSDIQSGMIFASLVNPGSALYHDQMVYRLSEKIDLDVFKKALGMMVKKHGILRTAFNFDAYESGLQIVYKDVPVKVSVFEMNDSAEEEVRSFISDYLKTERSIPFDINEAPLWRATLIYSRDENAFLLQFHHAIMDGWSIAAFITELNNLYLTILKNPNEEIKLVPLASSYKDFVIENLAEKRNDDNKEFWKYEMYDYKRLDIFGNEPENQILNKAYAKEHLNKLISRTKQDGLSLKGIFLSAFMYSLGLLTYEDDLTIGLVTNLRPLKEDAEKILGCFLNTTPFRFRNEEKFFAWKDYFEFTEKKLKNIKRRDRTTLPDIARYTGEKSTNENPFFDVIFNYINFHILDNAEKGLTGYGEHDSKPDPANNESLTYQLTNTLLDCSVNITGDELGVTFSSRKNLKSGKTLNDLLNYFEKVIECYLESYDEPIYSDNILQSDEKIKLLREFNYTSSGYVNNKTIVEMFYEQAKESPDSIAVSYKEKNLTYGQLNEFSNQLAHYLKSKKVKPGTFIPLCMDRGTDIIAAMLAIMKAGCAYVPVDPQYPEERIKFMIEDSQGQVVITDKCNKEKLISFKDYNLIDVDEDLAEIKKQSKGKLKRQIKPDDLAYVVYTSGSTGTPKGVMIEHHSLTNLIDWHIREYQVSSTSKATQMASPGFDAFGWEVLPYLSVGASVTIVDDNTRVSPADLMQLIVEKNITHSFVATALMEEFVNISRNKNSSLKFILTGGDKLSATDTEGLGYKIVNNYGPTENTVVATYYELTSKNKSDVPSIGKPISNTQIYIVNKKYELSPLGVEGEICISGESLALGYLNRKELTSEKFVPNPFSDDKSSRIYKTGDLARWHNDGNLEYLGRIDDQVKVRGFRIELGEIENVLNESDLIKSSVVIMKTDKQGVKRLIGYVTAKDNFDKEKIISYLDNRLPDYMIPVVWVEMESFPLTPNGKIDRKSLPDPDFTELLNNEYVSPQNETEEKLASIWRELLHAERVGVNDNFFELGGDSIISIQVVSRARRKGIEMQPRDLFYYPTIGSLTRALKERAATSIISEQGILTGESGLLPIQQWYLNSGIKNISHFNQSVLLSVDKSVSKENLRVAAEKLVEHHDALRFKFYKDKDKWNQRYEQPGENVKRIFDEVDLNDSKGKFEELIRNHSDKYQQSLNIEKGELVRFVLFKSAADEKYNRLLIVIHHLAVDGVSWRILLEDLDLLLTQIKKNDKLTLGEKTSSYRQWYAALQKFGLSRDVQQQNNYWAQVENSYEPLFPSDERSLTVKEFKTKSIRLDRELTQQLLHQVNGAYHTEINDILLCSLALTVCNIFSKKKISIGLEGHGRESLSENIDTSRTVGWFTNLYPVIISPDDSNDPSKVIKSVKEQLRSVPGKGLGYGVLKFINKEKNLSGKDSWDILFNYLGQLDNIVRDGKWLYDAGESRGSGRSQDEIVKEKLAVNSFIKNGELEIDWSYSSLHFSNETISELIKSYNENLKTIIRHCVEKQKTGSEYTPSDFGLNEEINFEEFDNFLDETYKDKRRRDYIESIYRLSGLQEGMLFHGLYDETGGAYTEQLRCDLRNPDLEILRQSLNCLLKNHTILRSGFHYNAFKVPVQCVYSDVEVPLKVYDYRNLNEAEKKKKLGEFEEADRAKKFDFEKAPLMRVTLIRLDEKNYRMYWTWYHILLDGWSMPVVIEEFLSSYEIINSGKKLPVKSEDRFEDYIRYIESADKESQENYWRSYMTEIEQGTQLPFIENKSQIEKAKGKNETLNLNLTKETTSRIEKFAHKNHVTINSLMQCVWSYILHQYTSVQDPVYGIIVSGRPDDLSGVENRVGLYLNTLPFHASVSSDKKIIDWLKEIQEQQISSRHYQYTPFKEIQKLTDVQGDLFDSLLAFENYPVNEIIKSRKWSLDVSNVSINEQTNYPLTIIISGTKQISIKFNYYAGLISENYAYEIRNHFDNVLMQIISDEKKTIGEIELLTEKETIQLSEFNNTDEEYAADKTVLDLFEEQVLKNPESAALMFEDKILTYAELNEQANKLAHYLNSKGIKNEMLIPVCINRSFEMIIGLIGILKAGGTYIPVDPDYPSDLINYMLEDSEPQFIIADKKFISEKETSGNVEVICIEDNPEIKKCPGKNPGNKIFYNHILCVIYTSGSSGKPKGVKVGNAGMMNRFNWMWKVYPFEKNEKGVIKTSLSFGDHVWEIFGPLLKGVCSLILKKTDILDIDVFIEKLSSNKITRLVLVPSLLRELLHRIDTEGANLEHLKYWTCSGEAISYDLVESFYSYFPEKNHKLLNIYGSTEVSADATYFETSKSFVKKNEVDIEESGLNEIIQRNVPIGKPIANAKIYIVNSEGREVPVGVTGEIWVGGMPVGEGYLKRNGLTSEKFVNDPFTKDSHSKIFKTGDIGRWLPDGNVEYLGRKDYQVKIRGYRVELGEIENVLKESGLVKNAVILSTKGKDESNHLVGYVIPKDIFNKKELTSYLRSQLPDYMVPALWVELDKLPLTPSGKIDKKLLPEVDVTEGLSSGYIAPQTEVEIKLAEIWKELLQIEHIGVEDNFFELGGHSLLAMRLVSAIRKQFEIELGIKDLFLYPTISSMIALIQLHNNERILPPIVKRSNQKNIPLSFAQERLWFIDRLEGSRQYHMPAALRLKGKLNFISLEKSLRKIMERQEVLRTVFIEEEERVYQRIIEAGDWNLKIVDGNIYKKDNDGLKKYIQDSVNTQFDLSKDYMMRAELIRLTDEDNVLVVTMHHIASDAWSLSVIVKELSEIYNSICESREPMLEALPIQYSDYAKWQRENVNEDFLNKKLEYWKSKLAGAEVLKLPHDFERPAVQNIEGTNIEFRIDKEMTSNLQKLGYRNEATLFMTLMTVFKILLYRYSNQQDISVGTSVSNRLQKETEGIVGFFVNMLSIRNEVRGEKTFTEILHEVKEAMLGAYENQEVPFEKVVDAIVKQREMNRAPLFQVLFILLNTPEIQEMKLGEIEMSYENYEHTAAQFDLNFLLSESPEGLKGFVGYRTSLYKGETIRRMISHFIVLINSILKEPDKRIDELQILTQEEERQLLFEFNKTQTAYPENKSIAEMFEEQAEKNPTAAAVIFEEEVLTFEELNKRSNKLANYLKGKGIGSGNLVAVCIGRSPELITGILGILKSGAAYVPIDPEYPEDRIRYMLKDIDAEILITGKEAGARLPQELPEDITVIDMEKDWNLIRKEKDENLKTALDKDYLAYVIYTSGSTGTPKGVMVTNKNVVSLVKGINYVNVNEGDVLLSTGSTSFDASTFEYWSMLLNGGTLILCPEKSLLDIELLKQEISKRKVKIMWFTSSWFNQLIDTDISVFEGLRTILAGGEKLSKQHINKIRKVYPEIEIINGYGPTENTTFSLTYKITEEELKTDVPIGKPLSNRTAYILDRNLFLCPVGVPGEICVGGDGVARGYLNNEELTSEKFIENPFVKNGEKLYRTGDTGRWMTDGNIEYHGRIDNQVKIRGYRIELGEIENVMIQSKMVKQAVVIVREDRQNEKRLMGYFVPEDNSNREKITEYLKGKLPEYMLPSLLIELTEMPLTTNGKIDKAALPEPDAEENISNEFVEPRNDVEKLLAEIWQEVLEVERVGIHDNFFELGGDSIIIIQILSRFRRSGHELQVADIFTYQTIAALSEIIQHREDSRINIPAEQSILNGECGMLPIQQWFFETEQEEISHFNQSLLLSIHKSVSESSLRKSIIKLEEHHDALRFSYHKRVNNWRQEYGSYFENLIVVDLFSADENEFESLIKEHAEQFQKSLNIEKGEVVKFVLFQTPKEELHNRILIIIHHLAVDGVSWRILLDDLETLITSYQKEINPDIGLKSSSYRQWYEALVKYGKSENIFSQKRFWEQTVEKQSELRVDNVYKGVIKSKDVSSRILRLNEENTHSLLKEVPKAYHTEINDILLCALAMTFSEWNSSSRIIIGLEGHGRENISEDIDTSRTVGWFTSLYPLAIEVPGTENIPDKIKTVKEQIRKVPDKGLGYGVLRYINKENKLSGGQCWEIVFNYLGQLDNVISAGKWLSAAKESGGDARSENTIVHEKISINGSIQGGELLLNWNYSNLHFKKETMERLVGRYRENLISLIKHCIEQQKSGAVYTPSDYGLGSEIGFDELDVFLNEKI